MTLNCVVTRKDKALVFSENKSTFRVSNAGQRSISCHTVDGCLITDGIRCDWLIVDDLTGSEVFIELKGCDLKHAIAQLCASVAALSKKDAPKKKGYVICTRSPLSSTQIQIWQKKVLLSHNLVLRVRKSVHEETIEHLIA